VKRNTDRSKQVFWWILFIIYLVGISYFLFFSERYGRTEGNSDYRYNLTLFQEINRFIKYHRTIGLEGFLVNLFGNVIAFMPFGFCLPIISDRDAKLYRVFFWTIGFSLMIETIQLLYKIGIFDVDDLLLNTCGGVLGYFCFCIFKFVLKLGGKTRVTKKRSF
jgi:glycopeptide antibiotics resistance protein